MPETTRASGLKITAPETFDIATGAVAAVPRARQPRSGGAPTRSRFRPVPMPAAHSPTGEMDALVAALQSQEMQLVDAVELQPRLEPTPSTGIRRRGAAAVPTTQSAKLELNVAPGEDAVVLVEQEGVYSWVLPARRDPAAGARRRGPGGEVAGTRVVFEIEVHASSTPDQRRDRRGFFTDLVYSKVKALVLKFVAHFAVGEAMEFLESNVTRGIVIVDSDDPTAWRRVEDLSAVPLPQNRSARVLLLVHGTFSSTRGSFGALGSTPWGREFLAATRTNYDAVIGFDHPTLSVDPLANAEDLLARLRPGREKFPPQFHVISYSRGALVFRSLVELLLPSKDWAATFARAVFVGGTNGGTQLAEPDNWHALADLYTNLATATARIIGLMPQATAVTAVLAELVQGLGALVKYMATEAVTANGVPGLAAMESDGPFVTRINQTQTGQPPPEKTWYYAISSEFKARVLGGEHEPKELPKRLVLALADGFIDQLMKNAPNDLVVDTASMTRLDPQAGTFIRDTFDFGSTPHVYHLNYFTRPEVANALARWLQLAAPPTSASKPSPRTRRARSGSHRAPLRVRTPSAVAAGETPVAVDTDIFVTDASTPVVEAKADIGATAPSYVVVRRPYQGKRFNYAYRTEEFLGRVENRSAEESLKDALDLDEGDRSPIRSTSAVPPAAESGKPEVVLSGDEPVGVLPVAAPIPDTDQLVDLARRTVNPVSAEDHILARRALPTFPSSAPPATSVMPPSGSGGGAGGRELCYFRAEMDEEVLLKHTATVEVSISCDVIGGALHAWAAEGSSEVDISSKVRLQILAKRNFEIVSEEDRVEIDPPTSATPQTFYFDVRATHADGGEGEIWVVARQGQFPLVTLVLRPRIASKRSGGGRRAVSSATSLEARWWWGEPLTQMFINEKINGSQLSYQFLLQAPDLSVLAQGESPPIRGNREQYVRKLYSEIENRWLSSSRDVEDFYEELRAYGAELLDELVPPTIQAALWQHRNKINSIMVLSEEPFIPWEVVHVKEPGRPLAAGTRFLGQMGLVRWLHEAGWPFELIPLRSGKARYIIPEYPHPDYVLPETAEERKFLEEEFAATPVQPTSSAVRKALSTPGEFDLLHFAGHGEAEVDDSANAALLLQGRVEAGNFVPEYFNATTAEYHSAFRQDQYEPGPVIVLNACQVGRASYKLTDTGGFARAFLKGGASAFVGTLWSVGDQPARSFTEEFYRQFKGGARLADAASSARAKAQADGDATWLAYVVYGHPHARWG